MQLIDTLEANEHPKFAEVLIGQERGCTNWIERHSNFKKSDNSEWFREESRAPKTVHRKTNQELETLVVKVRKSLMDGENEDTKYRCI